MKQIFFFLKGNHFSTYHLLIFYCLNLKDTSSQDKCIWQILLLGLYYMDEMHDRTFMVAFVFQQPTA